MKMKKKLIYVLGALLSGLLVSGCSSLFDGLNKKTEESSDPRSESNICFKGDAAFTLSMSEKYWDGTVYYSTDNSSWTEWDGSAVTAAKKDASYYVYLCGSGNTNISTEMSNEGNYSWLTSSFVIEGDATAVECSGNLMHLLDYEDPDSVTMAEGAFSTLFKDCSVLTKAPSLPAATLSKGCYYQMFKNCTSLTQVPDLPALTATYDCYNGMFTGCTALTTAPVISATKMDYYSCNWMFGKCTSLTQAPALPATELENMCYRDMFAYCTGLTATPALPAVTLAENCYDYMFEGCTNLESIGKIGNGETVNLVNWAVNNMFNGATKLKIVECESTDSDCFITIGTISGEGGANMFSGTASDSATSAAGKSYKVSVPCYNIDWNTTVLFNPDTDNAMTDTLYTTAVSCTKIIFGKTSDYTTEIADLTAVQCGETSEDLVYAYYDSTNTIIYILSDEKIVFEDDDLMYIGLDSPCGPFAGCYNADEIILKNINTSNLTSMCGMFAGCDALTSLDLSELDTKNVTSMYWMFYEASSLESITLGKNFDTSKVEDMAQMFYDCNSLKAVDVSGFDTSKVKTMSDMFGSCKKLASLDVSSFNTESVTNMYDMFYECQSLTSLDLSTFNTSNVLTLESFTNGCTKLESITFGENFITSNVKKMTYMFTGCKSLTELDLSSFDFSSVENSVGMFSGCTKLETIYVAEGKTFSAIKDDYGIQMFKDCTSLVGGSGTTYSESNINETYARVDGGTEAPGYFSVK